MGLDQALQQGAGRQRLAGDGLDLGQRVLQACSMMAARIPAWS
jgi:hypothetical protein